MKSNQFHSTLFLLLLLQQQTHTVCSQDDNFCPSGFSGFVAGPGCISYVICSSGVQVGTGVPCQPGTLFNEELSLCDFEENVECDTTALPTRRPTRPPTVPPTPRIEPTTPSPTLPPNTRSPSSNVGVEDALDNAQWDINNKLLLYESGFEGGWLPSTVYRYDTMLKALQLMYLEGVGDMRFYLGEDVHGVEGVKVGLVNIAAFLAQSMKETIKYNACDENNWDIIEGKYPLSNACGQLEQSYQDYVCPEGMEHMQCEVDPDMELKASTTAMWYGAPGPLFCGPTSKYPYTGYWDYSFQCDFPWKDPPEYCPDYPGQRGGRYDNSEPVMNRNNRTDVEGCCWWGRGVIQTTGICNFGILNYYLGKRAADEGRDARYPDIDFCKDPGLICSADQHKELKWIAGFFYWMKSVQTYDSGWNYLENLKNFVAGGMNDSSFIDAVSGIVNRGCHNPPCPNGLGQLDGGYERSENFKKVLSVLFEKNGDPRISRPSEMPTFIASEEESASLAVSTETNDETEEWVDIEQDWSDNAVADDDDEEEDWSNITGDASLKSNFYCGKTQTDAAQNCGIEENACTDGICLGDLKCYMIGECGSDTENDDTSNNDELMTMTPSRAPISATSTPTISANIETGNTVATLSSPAPVSPDSDESSNSGFDIKNTFYCGVDRADAATSCSTRCRSGSPLECPDGMSCFGYTPCPAEIEGESLTSTDSTPSSTTAPSASNTSPAMISPGSNAGRTQNYCAKSLDDLAINCATAMTCNDGDPDCPSGTYCWGNRPCDETAAVDDSLNATPVPSPATMETNDISPAPILSTLSPITKLQSSAPISIDGSGLYCAKTMDDLETSCSTAQECSSEPCPDGLFCFPFTCNNYSVGGDDQIQQLYCAETMEELKATCLTAQECHSGPCPPGKFCFPFDCTASTEVEAEPMIPTGEPTSSEPISVNNVGKAMCPPAYNGWISIDCFEYWECSNGFAGPIWTCPQGQRFDKVISACNSEGIVNEFCYGPPASNANDMKGQIDNSQETNVSPESNTSNEEKTPCREGHSGWVAAPGCREYYWCDNGHVNNVLHDCGENLLFDSELELCNFADQVICKNNVLAENPSSLPPPAPIPLTTPSPISKMPEESQNVTKLQDDKVWPASSITVEESEEDLPPWLANVIKNPNSSAASMMVLKHLSMCLLIFSTTVLQLNLV